MKFSEWMMMRENDDDLGLDLSMDMEMDTDVPPARPQATRPQVQAPRPQVQATRPQAPSSSISVPSGEVKLGGGNGKFLRGTKGVHDVKKKIYKIFANYLVPSGDKVFSGLVGLKERPVKVRLSLDDKEVKYDGGLETLLVAGVKDFMKSFKTVPKFGDLDGQLSVYPVESGMSIHLGIFIDQGNKDLYPRINLLDRSYVEQMGQLKKDWEKVVVTVKM